MENLIKNGNFENDFEYWNKSVGIKWKTSPDQTTYPPGDSAL